MDKSDSDEVQEEETDDVDGEMVFEFEVWYSQKIKLFFFTLYTTLLTIP